MPSVDLPVEIQLALHRQLVHLIVKRVDKPDVVESLATVTDHALVTWKPPPSGHHLGSRPPLSFEMLQNPLI